jgi:hypothetical protein
MVSLEDVRGLSRDKKYKEAIALVQSLIDEGENSKDKEGVIPAPYLELAKLYAKVKDPESEKGVLERYFRQRMARGSQKEKMVERYAKLCKKHGYEIPIDIKKTIEKIISGTMNDEIFKALLSSQ